MYIIFSILHFVHTLNTTVKDIALGVGTSIVTMEVGSTIGGEDITGHNVWDAIIKISIPIITGILIPCVNKWLANRKRKKR